ncbi:UNVERIFIED_CONTAM: hypothetical protein GTU68_025483, partial [Idotea baltica]|nr:hypothetical protein [Idotea baltica]
KEGGCQDFIYRGYGGNKNNFEDVDACLDECHFNGLYSYNYFSGCLKNIEVNDVNVLNVLKEENTEVQYHGVLEAAPLGYECQLEEIPSISFTTNSSYLELLRVDTESPFSLIISFKSDEKESALAYGTVYVLESNHDWELKFSETEVSFIIPVDFVNMKLEMNQVQIWNEIYLKAEGNVIQMSLNDDLSTSVTLEDNLIFRDVINIGGSSNDREIKGFIGCINKISLDQRNLDLRTLIGSSLGSDDVIMDACQVLNPCE